MLAQKRKKAGLARRKLRVRRKVTVRANRPRLVVRRSISHIYAQIVDMATGNTLVAASTRQPKLRASLTATGNVEAARAVGAEIAEATLAKGIEQVCFDRGGRKYHGRVKALAEAARQAGLQF